MKKGQLIEDKSEKGAQSFIVEWDSFIDSKVKSSQELLVLFENRPDIQAAVRAEREKIQNMPKHLAELLKSFSEQGIDKLTFNPLDILLKHYSPDEDDHSDLMAALLDPSRKHGLGKAGLYTLLGIVVQRKRSMGEICAIIRDEIKAEGKVQVKLRQRGEISCPDIIVRGHDFVIGIENKRSFGREHKTAYGWQTENQFCDLAREEKKHTLYVFIHPKGIAAASKDCVLIDKNDVANWYRRIAKQIKDEKLGAFLNFYADYYFKTI